MATKINDKYANFRYEIVNPDELREAKWLVEQGDFKDLDDYINKLTIAEIKRMKREDREKKKKQELRKKKRELKKAMATEKAA